MTAARTRTTTTTGTPTGAAGGTARGTTTGRSAARTRVLAVVAAAALLSAPAAAAPVTAAAASDDAPVAAASTAPVVTGEAAEILRLANEARAEAGVPALTIDPSLTHVARTWSAHMAAAGRMYHNPYVGEQIPSGWRRWGENVAYGYPTGAATHAGWMGSPGHRTNLLRPEFTHLGVGWVVDGRGRTWATQVFAQYPSGTDLPLFGDVPPGSPFREDVEWAAERGITTGYPGGLFRPSAPVHRDAVAAFLHRTGTDDAEPTCTGATRRFRDVPASHPFCGVVEWAAERGVTTGHPDGTYRPASAVTREAMAAFLHRYANPGEPDPTCTGGTRRFRDVPATHPFCGVIEWLAREGVTTGWPDGTFRPGAHVSREAMVAFLRRLTT